MHLGQIKWNGATTAAIFNGSAARPIPDYTLLDLICRADKEGETLPDLAARLAKRLIEGVPVRTPVPTGAVTAVATVFAYMSANSAEPSLKP